MVTDRLNRRRRLIRLFVSLWSRSRLWFVRIAVVIFVAAYVAFELHLISEHRLIQVGVTGAVLMLWLMLELTIGTHESSQRHSKVWTHQESPAYELSSWITSSAAVKIDLFAHSGENCLALLRTALLDAQSNNARLKSLTVRVLVRDYDTSWLIPRSVADGDEATASYKRELSARFAANLALAIDRIHDSFEDGGAMVVDIQVRYYLFEPFFKFMLVNNRRGLFGIYPIEKMHKRGYRGQFWDYVGERVNLIDIGDTVEASGTEIQMCKSLASFFDTIWSNFATTR